MEYTEIDLQIEDIMWFGVDKNGYVFECTSGGLGNVPDFVCKSKKNTEILLTFFTEEAQEFTTGKIASEVPSDCQLYEDCKNLVRKGLTCFDILDATDGSYTKIGSPVELLSVLRLPPKIQDILRLHIVDIDLATTETLKVKHAY